MVLSLAHIHISPFILEAILFLLSGVIHVSLSTYNPSYYMFQIPTSPTIMDTYRWHFSYKHILTYSLCHSITIQLFKTTAPSPMLPHALYRIMSSIHNAIEKGLSFPHMTHLKSYIYCYDCKDSPIKKCPKQDLDQSILQTQRPLNMSSTSDR